MRPRAAAQALTACLVAALLASAMGVLPANAQQPTAQTVPGVRALNDVWCAPDGRCLGVGFTPENRSAVVALRANGQPGPVRFLFGMGELHAIACPPGGGCIAVGGGGDVGSVIEVSRDGTPLAGRAVEETTELFDVACPTAATCIATGTRRTPWPTWPYSSLTPVFVVITNGQPGPPQDFPRGTRQAVGIECPTPTTCLVVGSSGFVVLTNNSTWSPRLHRYSSAPGSGYPTEEISCPSSTTCYATATGFVTTEGGSLGVPAMIAVSADGVAGPVQILTNQRGNAYGISCVLGRSCTVVGQTNAPAQGLVVDVFRGTPVAVTTYAHSESLTGVSCVAVATCGIVGNMPTYAVFAWHGPVPT